MEESKIDSNIESSSSSSTYNNNNNIINDSNKVTKSPLQQLQEKTQAMFKKQITDEAQYDLEEEQEFEEELEEGEDLIKYTNHQIIRNNNYDDDNDDNNVKDNDKFSTLINDLTSKLIDTRENAVRKLLSYCIPSMLSSLCEEQNLLTNLVYVIMQCQKGSEFKRDTYLRRTALRCLWSLSTDALIAAKTFYTNQSWTILCEFVPLWDDLESGIIFVSMMSLLLSSVHFVLSDDVMKDLCIWIESCFLGSSKTKGLDLDVLIAHPSQEGLSIIDGRFLQYFSINAHHGQGLPGLLLLALLNLGLQSENHAIWLIRNGGLDALQHVCISPKVNESIRSQARKIMLQAMSSSSFVRERILDSSIHLSSSYAHVPYPQGPDPLSVSCLSHDSNRNTEAFTQEWIPDQELDGLKRDVEFRPKSGGVGWFLCSSILWLRCPALRESLENYWSDETDETDDPLLISVNASASVLASLCKYLHTGIFLFPCDSDKKLELYAVASQLEMTHLASVVGDSIINCLSLDRVDDAIDFCKDYNLQDLERSCRTFKVAGHKPTIHFNIGGATNDSPGGAALKQAIMASLNDVTELLYNTSPATATTKIRVPLKEETNLLFENYEHQVEHDTSDSDINDASEMLSVANQSSSKKSVKSGGIYSLLLKSATVDGGMGALQVDGSSNTDLKVKKSAQSSQSLVKAKSSKAPAAKSSGKLPTSKVDATPKTKRAMALLASSRSSNIDGDEFGEPVEFDKRMSMEPESEISEREKKLQHISRPRTGGSSKEKIETEPAYDESNEVEELPVKYSSSPPRETFSNKSAEPNVYSSPPVLQTSVRGSLTLLKTKARRRRSVAEVDHREPEPQEDDYYNEPVVKPIATKVQNVVNKPAANVQRSEISSTCIRKAGCQCSNCSALASISLQQPIQSYDNDDGFDDGDDTQLFACGDCGRKFNATALEKHAKVCKKVFINSRKQFDMSKQRIQDDEQLRILQNLKKQKQNQKKDADDKASKWKSQSQQFREAMKAAREVSHAISTGAPLPPPTISAPDPSLIPCPHCGRRFNEKAAERHIPLCTSIRAKPTKLNKGGGISASAGVSLKDKKKHSTW